MGIVKPPRYGIEMILDLHDCDPGTFNRKSIKLYFKEVCRLIDMNRAKLCWWDDYGVAPEEQQTEPHLKGTSAVQFILTSTIVIHTLDLLNSAYVNVFSCKEFHAEAARDFTANWFRGTPVSFHVIERR